MVNGELNLLSFPFTKSSLVMYYNRSLLKRAGLTGEPPATWDEFEKQAAAVRSKTGEAALAFSIGAFAHSGGTDKNGCHHDRKNGTYHCH